jgi:hypothetical protein
MPNEAHRISLANALRRAHARRRPRALAIAIAFVAGVLAATPARAAESGADAPREMAPAGAEADAETSWVAPPSPGASRLRFGSVAGALLFGGSYGLAAVVGGGSVFGPPSSWCLLPPLPIGINGGGGIGSSRPRDSALSVLLLPVVGPLFYAIEGGRDDTWKVRGTAGERALVLTSGLLQIAGIVVFALDQRDAQSRPKSAARSRAFAFAPAVLPGGGGLTLAWER